MPAQLCHGRLQTDLLSGAGRADGSGWQASPNGVDGSIPAYGPYPNPVTMPNPHINPEGVHANLMWYWPGPGLPAPGSPPTTAYFRYRLNLEPGLLPQIVALVAADDQMTLTVNGVMIGSYELAEHMPNGQPEALVMDLTPGLILQVDEPATIAHFGLGVAALAWQRRRVIMRPHRRQAAQGA